MRANSASDTGPEVKLRKALWKAGVRGYRKNDRRIFGKPDLWFPRARLAVFVHGCFWHGCSRCTKNLNSRQNRAFWEAKIARNQARDAVVAQNLKDRGYRLAIVWECDLSRDIESIVATIRQLIHQA